MTTKQRLQRRAINRRWKQRHKKQNRLSNYKSTCKMYIKKFATNQELKQIIHLASDTLHKHLN